MDKKLVPHCQALVVQKLACALPHHINHHPADISIFRQTDNCIIRQIVIYPVVDSTFHFLKTDARLIGFSAGKHYSGTGVSNGIHRVTYT